MANIMSQIKLNNHTSRDGFDLSRKNAFTAKVGELLPVCCLECIPGDKIKGRVQHFTRTMPVNTAAFTRVREYYDWFFVPTNLLWNKFNTFVTQMVDNNQHATGITTSQVLTNQHPYFTTNQLANSLYNAKRAYEQNPSTTLTGKNLFGFSRYETRAKLLHYLGYGDFMSFKDEKGPTLPFSNYFRVNANLNPFPLLAYQKIYQDFFRNSQWESAYAPAFNIDYINGAANSLNIPLSQVDAVNIDTMLDLRYCNWNKDLFMGVLPNSQYGDSASIVLDSTTPYSTYLRLSDSYNTVGINQSVKTGPESATIEGKKIVSLVTADQSLSLQQFLSTDQLQALRTSLGLDNISILALRQSEALQKWKEITQSQQQDYKNQIEAHFGVSPSDALSERCKYIDGSVSNLDISEVSNTNLADSNAAVIAGKGVGVGDGRINFSTDVHGYLMCIYHAVPLLDYANDGIKRQNLKTMVTDYAIPEFDRTGMVQVPVVELTNSSDNADFTAELLGYAPRYYDYKQAIDEVHGAFIDGGLGSWVAPVDKTYIQKYLNSRSADGASLTYQWFKVNPSVLNPIFAQDVDSTNATDQLLVNSSFEISAVRNLDRNGLPF